MSRTEPSLDPSPRRAAFRRRWCARCVWSGLTLVAFGCVSTPRWREALELNAPAERLAQLFDADRLATLLGTPGANVRPLLERHRDDWQNLSTWPAGLAQQATAAGQGLGAALHGPELEPALRDLGELLREAPDDFRVRTGPSDASDARRALDPTQPLPTRRSLVWRIVDRLR